MTGIIQKSLHGIKAFIDPDNYLFGRSAIATGGRDKPMVVLPGSSDTVAVFDDFLETPLSGAATDTGVVGTSFIRVAGDTGCTVVVASATNGVARFTISNTVATADPATVACGIVGPQLAWKANQGPGGQSGRLRFGTRLKMGSISQGTVFVGFTDSVSAEFPIYDTGRTGDSGASAVTVAADAVGFHWGIGSDTGWRGVSAKSTAADSGDQQVTLTTVAPTVNTYQTLEVELHRGLSDTGGTATFYVDGIAQGSIVSPVATSTAMTPCVYFFDTGGNTLDVDWINVSAPRDTGA